MSNLGSGVTVLLLALSVPAAAQDSGAAARVLLDGGNHAASVPESMVVEQVMLSLMLPTDADGEMRRRWNLRLDRVGLSPADRNRLRRALDARASALTALRESQSQAWRLASTPGMGVATRAAHVRQLHQEQQAFIEQLYQDLLKALTPEGAARLQAFVNGEKQHIRILAVPAEAR